MLDIEATESFKQHSKPVIADDEDEDLFGEEQEASSEPKQQQDNDVDDLFGDEEDDEAAEKSNLNNFIEKNSEDEDDEDEEDQFLVKSQTRLPPIYDAKVPSYLKIQPTRFDASNFSKYLESIDLKIDNGQLTQQQLSLIKLSEENTMRWRFNKSESAGLEMESNTQLIEWEDGSMSLKLGEEVFDVIQSNLKDTYLMTKQENQTAADGDSAGQFSSSGSENALYLSDGAVVKSLKFVPTSTHSKIHKSLTSAKACAVRVREHRPTAGR
ncbi:hypothetical protein WICPIJ_009573 [Wickerhamomyces pijperi]|uniref:RNA polymerase-associated protein LEO1 n=1 Tax=Wickerhamomyces pijperi TaxID=599730 RepID=A0A9P8PLR0_WICPI|nr:hypothetical protein WICPIJ_009573 [Wickerhamomyces pijperi]